LKATYTDVDTGKYLIGWTLFSTRRKLQIIWKH